jgi:hypothetical protein
MAKTKLITMVTPNTLETMIEYTLSSSILNRICKLTKKTFGISKRSHLARPLQAFAKT